MKNWIKSFLYTSKHEKTKDDDIIRLLLPSFAGIALCMICLAGMTWAWFSDSVVTETQTIASANYEIKAGVLLVKDGAENETVEPDANGGYELSANEEYEIKLTASGTASTGYCDVMKLKSESDNYDDYIILHHTAQIKSGETMSFTFIPEESGIYKFAGVWGTYAGDDVIKANAKLGNKTVPVSEETTSEATDEKDSEPKNTQPAKKDEPTVTKPVTTPENKDSVDKNNTATSEETDATAEATPEA